MSPTTDRVSTGYTLPDTAGAACQIRDVVRRFESSVDPTLLDGSVLRLKLEVISSFWNCNAGTRSNRFDSIAINPRMGEPLS